MNQNDDIELLLVEDNDEDAQYVRRLLTEFGRDRLITVSKVHRAGQLTEALEMLDDDPDIVLLDLGLPDSNGLETVETVVGRAPHLPVVVITGNRERSVGQNAIKAGAQDYLEKGKITRELLDRTIRYSIDRHGKQREIVELNHRLAVLNRILQQDIRDDIHIVVGHSHEFRAQAGPREQDTVDSLLDAAQHALELTDRANELITVLSTDSEPTVEPVSVQDLIDNVTVTVQNNHDCSLTVEGTEKEIHVRAIPMLQTAVEQLLNNAVRHNDSTSPELTVSVTEQTDTVSIAVADDGVGISTRQKTLLNDPESRYHEQAGIGTGLYLTFTVVDQIDGQIEFSDNTPSGTVVTVTLHKSGRLN